MSTLVSVFMLVVGFVWLAQFVNWSDAIKKEIQKKFIDHMYNPIEKAKHDKEVKELGISYLHHQVDWTEDVKWKRKRIQKKFPDFLYYYYGYQILGAIGLIGFVFIFWIGLIAAETF